MNAITLIFEDAQDAKEVMDRLILKLDVRWPDPKEPLLFEKRALIIKTEKRKKILRIAKSCKEVINKIDL